ncbi:hypothetical protein [Kaistella carnis]|uniref:Uncharacterized protein n=1 Tax=Kaistella carnis TaxID=1241979 RepID=A0A3G8XXT8_9FLAO|nr:hypothetical protein [Kaistella carnis]AZI33561.1 hypothetical protein EIB73_10360 [Kaistella carnis]
MQNLQDIQDKIFFETKSILESLAKIESADELIMKQGLFAEAGDRIAFLRILEKNKDDFDQIFEAYGEKIQKNYAIQKQDEFNHDDLNEEDFAHDVIEEEVIFTNELNNFDAENVNEEFVLHEAISASDPESSEDLSFSEPLISNVVEKEIPLIVEQENLDYEERIAQKERELEEMEERRRKIVEFSKHEQDPVDPQQDSVEPQHETPLQQAEKKFRLANIKGLKVVQQLFDDDPLEHDAALKEKEQDPGSLLKTNIKTDFMEAERKKPEFKLDLNDRVAFSKSLFNGDVEELKITIDKLNSFGTLEEAKQYLSEIYYKKDWSKSDEYAQRLWNLVENKFM